MSHHRRYSIETDAVHAGERTCPQTGAVDTPMLWSNPLVKSGQEHISGAVGQPEDIAAVIAFLASDEARFVNGTTVIADGARLDIL